MKYFYKMWKGINELSESLLIGILFFFILNLSLQNYEVVGDSMVPNYQQGDRLLLMKFSYMKNFVNDDYLKPFNPKRGDVIVFNYPLNQDRKFIKRIILSFFADIANWCLFFGPISSSIPSSFS